MTSPRDPALSPDAPQFTPIDLSKASRSHPIEGTSTDAPHEQLPPLQWVSWPEQDDIDRAQAETLDRIAAFELDPSAPVGAPGSIHTVMIGYAGITMYGALHGMDIVLVPVCAHGHLPPIEVVGINGTNQSLRLEYCDECGIYLPERMMHSRNAGIDGLLQQRRRQQGAT